MRQVRVKAKPTNAVDEAFVAQPLVLSDEVLIGAARSRRRST